MALRILIVDDDKQIVRLLRSYIEQSGYETLTAYDGNEALHMIRAHHPDLVVLDLMLPGLDGWEITRIIRSDAQLREMPIIMLTARVEDTDRIVGLELGADDYISKPFNPREVVARIRAVLRRVQGKTELPRVLTVGDLRMEVEQHVFTFRGEVIDLTPTEFSLLQLFMQSPGRAFTRPELIEKSLGYTYEGMERTVDSHIKNLRKKIPVEPGQPGYIETVYGVGYRLVAEA